MAIQRQLIRYSDVDPNLELDGKGNIRILTNADAVVSSVKTIMTTYIGERVFLIPFASRLNEYLFDPNDELTQNECAREITEMINKWDDRPQITSIQFFRNVGQGELRIQVNFTIKGLSGDYNASKVYRT